MENRLCSNEINVFEIWRKQPILSEYLNNFSFILQGINGSHSFILAKNSICQLFES